MPSHARLEAAVEAPEGEKRAHALRAVRDTYQVRLMARRMPLEHVIEVRVLDLVLYQMLQFAQC